ncbi:MAG: glycosyltransferase [Actinobacteria bacterium]|nr:glycosyltransferase [Actinomycetota bacterium]
MPEIAFVMAPRQNLFWVEIVQAIRKELQSGGIQTSISTDGFPPPRADMVYALVPPHEWFALEVVRGHRPAPSPALLRRTLFLCGEQPGTSHFDENVELGREAGAIFDLNVGATREYQRRGLAATHFQLGYTSGWDHTADAQDHDIDILFLGAHGPRRDRFMGAYADSIWRKHCHIVFADNSRPNWEGSNRYLAGNEKWKALGRAKVLINVHQGGLPYFEWHRVIQVLTNRCVLVTEESTDYAPLEPGKHFVSGRPETLALLAHRVLEDDDWREALQRQAYEYVREKMPLRDAVSEFAGAADEVARAPVPRSGGTLSRQAPNRDSEEVTQPAWSTEDLHISTLRRAAKDTALELLDLRRTLQRFRREYLLGGEFPLAEVAHKSRAYEAARPRVSVLTSVYNHGEHLDEALGSVIAGRFRPFELVVVDDASTDDSLDKARAWMQAHDSTAGLLLHHPVNRGLPHARNTALGFARGEFVFILDSDNALYPNGLDRLVAGLDLHRDASFAYGLHQRFSATGPAGVMNIFPWEPRRLRTGNYIDAMALLRTRTLREVGGYTTDRRLHGWEDYELWCRLAELGHHGVFVPQFVARYRVAEHSMLSLSNLSATHTFSILAERYPKLMAGVQAPL